MKIRSFTKEIEEIKINNRSVVISNFFIEPSVFRHCTTSIQTIPGSCLEDFQPIPFMQASISCPTCMQGIRKSTDKTFWLAVDTEVDFSVMPMQSIKEIQDHISKCRVCVGTRYILTRHSSTNVAPNCPNNFYPLWTGYSYLMVC